MQRRIHCVTLLAVFTVIAAVSLFAPDPLPAEVTGTPHDFFSSGQPSRNTNIAPAGVCTACHTPHGADGNAPLWSRSLSLYVSRLTMNGDPTGEPNYTVSPTLACYDCHDDHSAIEDNPLYSAFAMGYKPQDTAFGDGPGGTKAGYYEHSPPNTTGGSYGVFSYPGQFNPANSDNLAKSGGHYFKQDPTGSTATRPDVGDKLSCRDCHDPHSSLQAFIRTDLPNSSATPGLGASYTSVTASSYMSNNTGRTRNNAESRKICVACHAYSNNGTPVRFNQVKHHIHQQLQQRSEATDHGVEPQQFLDVGVRVVPLAQLREGILRRMPWIPRRIGVESQLSCGEYPDRLYGGKRFPRPAYRQAERRTPELHLGLLFSVRCLPLRQQPSKRQRRHRFPSPRSHAPAVSERFRRGRTPGGIVMHKRLLPLGGAR